MKIYEKVLFSVLAICLINPMSAQIVIDSGDMPQVGDTIPTASDTLLTGVTVGNAGTNITWDFNGSTPDLTNTNYVEAPAATPDGGSFPNADLAITQNFSEYVYVDLTTLAYTVEGLTGDFLGIGLPLVVQLNPTYDQYRFPTQYGNSFTGNYGFQQTIPESDLPTAIKQQIQNMLPNGVTLLQLRTTYTVDFTDDIDGWGTVITPICSYKALREKRVEDANLTVDAQVSIFGFPSWQNGVVDTSFTINTYNWLTKDTKLPVLSITADAAGNANTLNYSLIPPALDAEFSASNTSFCETATVDFTDESEGCPTGWQWTFQGGTPGTSAVQNPTGITYNSPGTYQVMLEVTKGAQSNSEVKSTYITVSPPPTVSVINDTVCLGETGTITAMGGVSYSWSSGENTASVSKSPAATTTYTVTVTDANGCTATGNGAITVNPLPAADAGVNDTICLGETGNLMASGGVSYTWNIGINTAGLSAAPTSNTQYVVSVTDVNGCTDNDSASIIVKSLPAVDAGINDTICQGEVGSLTASGASSYLWNTGADTASVSQSPSATTSYSVTGTGANGCSASDNAMVVVNPLPAKNLNDLTICFGSTTILDAGNPGSSYSWSTGALTKTITVTSGGAYSVTVTDANGCVRADTSTVTQGTSLTIGLSDHEVCQGDSVMLNAGNPGTDHVWSTGDTTQTIAVTGSGEYSVTVTDAVGCSGEDTSEIVVNPLPLADAGTNDTVCKGETVVLNASGGIAYQWNTGAITATISVTPSFTTNFVVTVTDTNNCVVSDSVDVIVNQLPVAEAGPNDTVCFGQTGSLTASGGTSYLWEEGTGSATLIDSPLTTTTYTVTVVDDKGCSASDSAMITVHPLPNADAGANDTICVGNEKILSASGGVDYIWDTGADTSTLTVSPLTTTGYYVTVTNAFGCLAYDSVVVGVNSLPMVSFTGLVSGYCPYQDAISLVGTPAGGIFSGDGVVGNTFVPSIVLPGDVYFVTYAYSDSNGCMNSDTQSVEVYQSFTAGISGLSSQYCEDAFPVDLTGLPEGGVFSGPGVSDSIFNPEAAGVGGPYPVVYTFTDTNNCTFADTQNVMVDSIPVLAIMGLDSSYCTNDDAATLTGVPAGGAFSGSGVSNDMFDPATAGIGTHIITYAYEDVNGCGDLAKINVTVDICEGITPSILEEQIFVYPNPAQDEVHVKTAVPSDEVVKIDLYTSLGERIYTQHYIGANEISINTQDYMAGIYFLKIKIAGQELVKKVIVSK